MRRNNIAVDKNDFFINLSHQEIFGNRNSKIEEYIDFHEVNRTSNTSQQKINETFKSDLLQLFRWNQFRRSLNVETISDILKGHIKFIFMLFVGCWLLFKFNNNVPANLGSQPNNASLFAFQDMPEYFTVSEEERIQFIDRYAKVAIEEMNKYGIPASISLALAILNSNYGFDSDAVESNNLFKLKCSENHLESGINGSYEDNGTCYSIFKNNWFSFRANSKRFLSRPYNGLTESAGKNYKLWLEKLEMLSFDQVAQMKRIILERKLYQYDF